MNGTTHPYQRRGRVKVEAPATLPPAERMTDEDFEEHARAWHHMQRPDRRVTSAVTREERTKVHDDDHRLMVQRGTVWGAHFGEFHDDSHTHAED